MNSRPSIPVGLSARVAERHVGGNTTYVRRLYESLAPLGVDASLLRPPRALPGNRSLRYLAYEALAMQRDAVRQGCRLVHFPADTGPVRRGALPVVVTLHGVAALHEPDVRSAWAGRIWLARARRAALSADVVITVSDSSREDIERLLGPSAARPRIEVIHHGIDLERFSPALPAEQTAALERHAVGRPFVLYLGNIEPRKNIGPLVAAVDLLNRDGHDVELLVGGKPAWDYEETLAAIDASPHARRLGWLSDDDVRALMSACETFAFPSRYEGFGLPVLEAMACGAPVMCTRRGSLPEVAGDLAFYAEGTEPEHLAAALSRALGSRTAELSERSVAHARTFSWERSARRHLDVFAELAG